MAKMERVMRERGAVERTVNALIQAFGQEPPAAVITLGSGLGPTVASTRVVQRVATPELSLPPSTVPGHAGEAILADIGETRVLFLSGRVHYYEGYSMDEVVRYVRAAWAWGVPRLILTCSAGSVRADLPPGTLTRLTDQLNLMGGSPLFGGPIFDGEVRFPDASGAHRGPLHSSLVAAADEAGVKLPGAVYAALSGPAYETAAEVRMVQRMGADLVGMSTVPEVLAATALGLQTAALAVVSNYGAGVGEGDVDHDAVTAVAGQTAQQLSALLHAWAPRVAL